RGQSGRMLAPVHGQLARQHAARDLREVEGRRITAGSTTELHGDGGIHPAIRGPAAGEAKKDSRPETPRPCRRTRGAPSWRRSPLLPPFPEPIDRNIVVTLS